MNNNEPILEASERIGALIRQGKCAEAEIELEQLPRTEKAWRRLIRHYNAKIKLIQGDYNLGCKQLHEIILEEGPHILIYADLVAGYFMSKQYTKWQLSIEDLKKEFSNCRDKLDFVNKCRAEIILAKSLELTGFIAESYSIFMRLSQVANLNFRIKGLTNLVRLEAQYPLNTDFSKHYLLLKSYAFGLEQPEYDYDVLHSLLLTEAVHIDIKIALETFSLIPRSQICFFTLGYYELLDIWLRSDKTALLQMTEQFGVTAPFTVADTKLLMLAKNEVCSDWHSWPNEIPIAQYFRLLRFIIDSLSVKDRKVCLAQALFFIKALSSESKKIWTNFFTNDGLDTLSESSLQLRIVDAETVSLNDVPLALGRQKLVLKMLKTVVANHGYSSFEQISKLLWNTEPDLYSADRIRQLVKRTNNLVKKSYHMALLNIRENSVVLASGVKY